MPTVESRSSRIGLDIFYLYIGLVTLINGFIATRAMRGWILGDWLINYEGGFVRRGLAGEMLLQLGRLFHTTPVLFAVLCYLSLYAVFFLSFRDIASRAVKDFWVYALILSPATLSFQVLHRGSGFRKEVIYLAALALFVALLERTRMTQTLVVLYVAGVLIVSTLCHEGLIFYAPYFVAALLISGRSAMQTVRLCAVPMVCGAVAFGFCYSHLGNAATASQICSSIGYTLQAVPGSTDICSSGAIPYLVKTRATAGQEAWTKILDYQYLWIFPCYFALALLPAIAESILLVRSGMRREARILWGTFTVSFLGTLVLFRYAVDWGRWIYIHVVSITVLLLFMEGKRRLQPQFPAVAQTGAKRKTLQWAFVLIYATFWIIPNDTEVLRMGYAGRVLETLHITAKPPNAERIPTHTAVARE